MRDGVYIRFDDIRPALHGASKKMTGVLFRAILDYAEVGLEPKAYDPGPFTPWLLEVFPSIKAMIDGEAGKHG